MGSCGVKERYLRLVPAYSRGAGQPLVAPQPRGMVVKTSHVAAAWGSQGFFHRCLKAASSLRWGLRVSFRSRLREQREIYLRSSLMVGLRIPKTSSLWVCLPRAVDWGRPPGCPSEVLRGIFVPLCCKSLQEIDVGRSCCSSADPRLLR